MILFSTHSKSLRFLHLTLFVVAACALPRHLALADDAQPLTATAPLSPAMPTTSPKGWTQIYAEDFLTNVPVGGFTNDGNSSDLTPVGSAYKPYHDRIKTYADGQNDTAKKAKRFPSKTTSVSNSCLDIYLHTEEINGVATALGGSVIPIVANPPSPTGGQIYGRFSARMRVVGDTALGTTPLGYGGVWLLWQDTNTPKWPLQGEIDFPEGGFAGKLHAFAHHASPTRKQDAIDTTADYSDWHIVTTEWMPGSLKFFVDGALVGTSTVDVPSTSMHYLFQCGSSVKGAVDPTSSGHVQIDWIVIEKPAP